MNPSAIVAKATREETVNLLIECVAALPDEELFKALDGSLSDSQKEELAAKWSDE